MITLSKEPHGIDISAGFYSRLGNAYRIFIRGHHSGAQ